MSLITNFKSQVIAVETFSRAQFDLQKDLLIVDKNVLAVAPELREGWKFVYEVNGGETLKDFAQFSSHVEEILKVWQIPIGRQSRIVACGGGC